MDEEKRVSTTRRRKKGRRRGQGGLGWLVAAGIAALALLLGGLYVANQSGASTVAVNKPTVTQGSLKIDPGEINMGDIKLGRTVDASFKIQNVGDKTVTITDAPFIEVVKGC